MRITSINDPSYVPADPPDNSELSRYLREELSKVKAAIDLLAGGKLPVTTVAPPKPRDGDIKLADGTNWNPYQGEGVYCYYNDQWNWLSGAIGHSCLASDTTASVAIPTTPTVLIIPDELDPDSQYDNTTGVITIADDCFLNIVINVNLISASGQKTFYFDGEFYISGAWVRSTNTAKTVQIKSTDGVQTGAFVFSGYLAAGTIVRIVAWADSSGMTRQTVTNSGSTSPSALMTYTTFKMQVLP
jgi:hypothetical protein